MSVCSSAITASKITRHQVAAAVEHATERAGSSTARYPGAAAAAAADGAVATTSTAAQPTPATYSVSEGGGDGHGVGNWQVVKGRHHQRRNSLVVGDGPDSSVAKGVPKKVSLHVTRIHPSTKFHEMQEMIKTNFPEASVEQIQSKYPEDYSSFKVTIFQSNFPQALNVNKWPKNTIINGFFQRKRDATMIT
nr:unnamed protein product [Callosobruchus analis]